MKIVHPASQNPSVVLLNIRHNSKLDNAPDPGLLDKLKARVGWTLSGDGLTILPHSKYILKTILPLSTEIQNSIDWSQPSHMLHQKKMLPSLIKKYFVKAT